MVKKKRKISEKVKGKCSEKVAKGSRMKIG